MTDLKKHQNKIIAFFFSFVMLFLFGSINVFAGTVNKTFTFNLGDCESIDGSYAYYSPVQEIHIKPGDTLNWKMTINNDLSPAFVFGAFNRTIEEGSPKNYSFSSPEEEMIHPEIRNSVLESGEYHTYSGWCSLSKEGRVRFTYHYGENQTDADKFRYIMNFLVYFSNDSSTSDYDIDAATSSWSVNDDGGVKAYYFEDDKHLEIKGTGDLQNKWKLYNELDPAIIKSINIGDGVKASGTDTESLFFQWYDLENVTFENPEEFTRDATSFNQMFASCYELKSIDLTGFNTANVTKMPYMFTDCKNLQSVDISGLDTSNVTDMSGMFWGCENINNITIGNIDTSQVTNMGLLFSGCKNLSHVDISGIDTANVHDMWGMFEDCKSMTSIDLSKLDTSMNVKYLSMFKNCESLKTLDISGFDMTRDYDNSGTYMLEDCKALEKLITPKVGNTNVHLPKTMYDGNGGSYTRLPASSITLTASKPATEGDSNGANTNTEEIKKIAITSKQKVEIKSILMDAYQKAYPDAIVKKIKFKSSNKKVAKVNKKGTVTGGKKSGETDITMFVKTQYTVTKSNGKTKNKLSKWTSAGSITVSNTGK